MTDQFFEALEEWDVLIGAKLSQYNNVLNVSNRLLDLVISNSMCTVEEDSIPLVQTDDHHPALCIRLMNINIEKDHLVQMHM
nr:unnamed protein product [Callosobruchus chinensis]